MLLRDHPLMSYRGVRNWPPSWTWLDGVENKYSRGSLLRINPVFAQFESVFFGLFFCLKRSIGGFDSFYFYCLVQVTIKNQASRVPLILRCLNCHSINRIAFI